MQKKNFQDILMAYFETYPEYIGRDDIHFFFDEIHEIEGWEKFIRRLIDQEKVHIYITGSSAKLLGKEIASSLRGRTIVTEIFPFDFVEMLEKSDIAIPRVITGKIKAEMMHYLDNFLMWGGFPEVIGTDAEYHRTMIQWYMATVLYRDIIDRYQISATHALKSLLTHCLRNSARVFSINKMHNVLKSSGLDIGKNSLYKFMDYFEDAFCVFSVSKYNYSHQATTKSLKKIYAVDQGLITAVTLASDFDLGAQLETAVFSALRRLTSDIYYYKTQDGKEVDFLILMPDQHKHLFQVCRTMSDPATRLREISALTTAMKELSISKGTIITLDDEEEIKIQQGTIKVEPIWKLYLESGFVQ